MRYAYKRVREHGRRMASYQGEIVENHPAFSSGSAASVSRGAGHDLHPTAIDAPDIVYTASDDEAIDKHLKAQSEFPISCIRSTRNTRRRFFGSPQLPRRGTRYVLRLPTLSY